MANSYSGFIYPSNRSTGELREINIIKSDRINDMVVAMSEDRDLGEDVALATVLCLSGALRINECLQIKRSDCELKDGRWVITVKVSKKREKSVSRNIVLIKDFNWLLEKVVARKRYNEFLFKGRNGAGEMTRFSYYSKLKRRTGLTPHSLRHSCISFLLSKKMTDIQIAALLKMSVNNVRNYIHCDQKGVWEKVWA